MLDRDPEMWKFKLLLGVSAAFLISAWFVFQEFQYLLWGQKAEVTVSRVYNRETRARRGSRTERVVGYSFQDGSAGNRNESTTVALDWEPPESGRVTIQYVPGAKNRSRLDGQRNTVALTIFFGTLLAGALLIWKLACEANAPIPKGSGMRR